jgi:hypothetical protein
MENVVAQHHFMVIRVGGKKGYVHGGSLIILSAGN